jgi:hypothetical protein
MLRTIVILSAGVVAFALAAAAKEPKACHLPASHHFAALSSAGPEQPPANDGGFVDN